MSLVSGVTSRYALTLLSRFQFERTVEVVGIFYLKTHVTNLVIQCAYYSSLSLGG